LTYRLGELAELVGGVVEGDAGREIDGVAALDRATSRQLSFLTNRAYLEAARRSAAGALLVPPAAGGLPHDRVVVENPYLALAAILELLHPEPPIEPGVDPTAHIHAGARLAEDVAVGPYACVGDGSVVESGAVLAAHVVVGRDCHLGPGCVLHPMVVLYDRTILGAGVVLHAGVVIGADGFGYAQSSEGHRKVPQVGRVIIEDRVEIGANSTVDRAMLHATRIGEGTKIDDLVMVAHNVEIGSHCLLIAQVGVAGSARLGDHVVLAGQTGVAGHVDVGDGVQVASKSAVFKPARPGSRLAGIPAIDSMSWRRQQVRLRRLQDLEKRLAALERRVDDGGE
jgi:UDP-3-O-[3-hydroxymyristoyl] glucosamine N-acyltransferase